MSAVVLVTGGNGVIGSWVCHELARRGATTVVLDRAPRPAVSFPDAPPPTAIEGDLRDSDLLRETMAAHGVDRVLHLGGIVGEPAERDPTLAIEVNAVATARLLDLAAAAGVARVVAMSTKGVLGPLPARFLHPIYEPVPVDHPPSPRSIYETSKLVVERLVVRAREAGRSVAAVRLATTWGPGKSSLTHAGYSLHSDVVAAAAEGRSSRLDVHPDQGYDLVYYADVAAGLAAAMLSPAALRSPVYHLGSGRIVTMGAFAAAVEAAFPGVRVELGERFSSGRSCRLDIEPAAADFEYRPAWGLARALADVRRRSQEVASPPVS